MRGGEAPPRASLKNAAEVFGGLLNFLHDKIKGKRFTL